MLRQILRVFVIILLFALLTVLTQVGGVVLLVALAGSLLIRRFVDHSMLKRLVSPLLFIVLYAVTIVAIVPPLAKKYGRVALPWSGNLQPLTLWTCLLNRHYVTPSLKEMVTEATEIFTKAHPDRKVNYLDANFPFIKEFPLWPHLSHDDGRKLDIAFFYVTKNGEVTSKVPSVIGYGVCEGPMPGEVNYPERCAEKGYWQYSLLAKLIPQGRKSLYTFDGEVTADFVKLLLKNQQTQKLFIEPHLKERLKLQSSKIRFQGCQAVRHDDHIHVQVK